MKKTAALLFAFLFVLFPLSVFAQISVLNSETHKEFAAQHQWTGGPETYSRLVEKLAGVLAGSQAEVKTVSDADIASGVLGNSTSVFVIDTLATQTATLEKIKDFVTRGGLMVVIGDYARNVDGAWQTVWPCADMMGLEPVSCDQWGAATSMSGTLFAKARQQAPHPLLKGLNDPLDFGAGTYMCWVCKPNSAKVLAQFPSYLSTANDNKKTVDAPCVAVSVNSFGKGHAAFISVLPGGKQMLALKSPDIRRLLLNLTKLAPEKLAAPVKAKQTISIDVNQIGFKPGDEKIFTLRIENADGKQELPAEFTVADTRDNSPAYTSNLTKFPALKWKGLYLTGNFSALKTPGKYRIRAGNIESPAFGIREDIYHAKAIPAQLSFLRKMAAGLDYYTRDEPRGGFVDASGDYSVRMWSMPYVVYCLAGLYENLTESELKNEAFFLFNHGTQWLIDAYTKEGGLISGVGPGNDIFKPDRRPWQDKTARRALTDPVSSEIIMAYCAAMAKAAMVYKQKNNGDTAAKCLAISTEILNKNLPEPDADTKTLGNALWASTRLYAASGNESFYKQAIPMAREIISRQIQPSADNLFPNAVAGMFSDSPNAKELIQYKMFHSIGIYLGLIELYEQCARKQNDSLALEIKNALLLWQNSFLLKMSALSPYGQAAHGIEPAQDGYEIRFFPPRTAWTERHGLNCDHSAQAYVARRLNEIFPDRRLLAFAARQIYWINGHNPLGVCMIESLGTTSPPSMPRGWGTGILAGAMPNGISGTPDDSPCWINGWQSMEYWLPQTVFYLLSCSSPEFNYVEKQVD